jgi:septal ring factor EnvC (AmiA/AmiB activator)
MELLQFIFEKWGMISSLAALAASIFVLWLSSRFMPRVACTKIRANCESLHKEMRVDNDKQEKRLDADAAALAQLAALVQALPTADDLHRLEIIITRLDGRINSLEVEVRGQGEVLKIVRQQGERINSFLMAHGK